MIGERSALVLLHFQNEIVTEAGAVGRLGNAEQVRRGHVLDNVAALLAHARAAGRPVVHVGSGYGPGYLDANLRVPHFARAAEAGLLQVGSWGAEFCPSVAPIDGDLVLYRPGLGVLAGTPLGAYLTTRGVDHLVICGVSTRIVVEAVVLEACDHGYAVTVVTDGCAAGSAAKHQEALDMLRGFATLADAHALLPA